MNVWYIRLNQKKCQTIIFRENLGEQCKNCIDSKVNVGNGFAKLTFVCIITLVSNVIVGYQS